MTDWRQRLFAVAVGVTRHLLGAVVAAVFGGVGLAVLLLIVHPLIPAIAEAAGWARFSVALTYWLWGVLALAAIGLIRPRWFLRDILMSIDV